MKTSGFTLIELLVTVAIVGILAAIGIANFNEYRKNAYDTAAKAYAREMIIVAEAWISTDWDGEYDVITSWRRDPDGTILTTGLGAELVDYIEVNSSNQDYLLFSRVDPGCYLGQACDNGIVQYGCSGHCPSAETTMRRHCLWQYEDDSLSWRYDAVSKATYHCT